MEGAELIYIRSGGEERENKRKLICRTTLSDCLFLKFFFTFFFFFLESNSPGGTRSLQGSNFRPSEEFGALLNVAVSSRGGAEW